MSVGAAVALSLRSQRRRLLGLLAFAALFLAAGLTARVLAVGPDGHVELDPLFLTGGYTLVSALLLLGWMLGRYPLIATLVLLAGFISHDVHAGYARLYQVRPVSPLRFYAARFAALAAGAFVVSAVLLPAFDLLMLGTWAGPATFVLILSYVLAYGGLVALLSVWTRADAWVALLLAITAMIWDALRQAGRLPMPPGPRELVSVLLPPQAALGQLEGAFANIEPIPWGAFFYAAGYGVLMLILAGVSLVRREI